VTGNFRNEEEDHMKRNPTFNKMMLGLLAALTLAGAVPARAETAVGDRGFSIGPRATFVKPKDAEEGSWYGGAQMRFGLGRALGLEGSIDYRKNEYANDVDVIVYPVQASLLAYLAPDAPVSPFLLGGAGWYYTRVEGPNNFDDTDYRFGPHAGAGLEIALGPTVSLDGTYRYVWLKKVEARDENELTAEYNDSGYMVTIGLNFRF
jgi:opacity protein-like surface antigen